MLDPNRKNKVFITKVSLDYDNFVSSLGWTIDLATHPGYLGGLERNSTNGTTSVYYCTSTIELIFHDVTKMPTDPNDFKQLKKVIYNFIVIDLVTILLYY